MIRDYAHFLRAHCRQLVFGLVLMALSSFGQTFYISLFGGELRHAYDLSAGGLGGVYAAATVCSAFTLQRVGRWIDRTTVPRFTLGVMVLLAVASALMASGRGGLPVLFVTFYLLRLGGQGLMVHTALTVTARAFPLERGKALGLANLGMPGGEAVFPLAVAFGVPVLGWHGVWLAGIAVLLAGTGLALAALPARAGEAPAAARARARVPQARAGTLWRDPRVLFSLPAILAAPFIATGFFFQQDALLAEKHWAFEWWASCFVFYALARAGAMVAIGPLIDRIGAVRVLPFFLAPLGVAMASIAFVTAPWGAAAFLVPIGISAGVSSTLLTALWVELYGADRLAEVRARIEGANVLASGTSPIVMGYLIDLGVPLSAQAAICLFYVFATSLLARRVAAYAQPIAVDS